MTRIIYSIHVKTKDKMEFIEFPPEEIRKYKGIENLTNMGAENIVQ